MKPRTKNYCGEQRTMNKFVSSHRIFLAPRKEYSKRARFRPPLGGRRTLPTVSSLCRWLVIVTVTLLTLSHTGSAIHLLSANSFILNSKPLPSSSSSSSSSQTSQTSSSPSSLSSSSSSSSSSSHLPSASSSVPLTHLPLTQHPQLSHPSSSPSLTSSSSQFGSSLKFTPSSGTPTHVSRPDLDRYLKIIEKSKQQNANKNNDPESETKQPEELFDGSSNSNNNDAEFIKLLESMEAYNRLYNSNSQQHSTSGQDSRVPVRNTRETIPSSTSTPSPILHHSSSFLGSSSIPIQTPLSLTYSLSQHNQGLTGNGHFWLSSIRSNFLNLENTLQAKLSTIENKVSNLDVKSSIWRRGFTWKIDEMNMRIVQSDSKSSLTREHILERMAHFEKLLYELTDNSITKIAEKITKLEQTLQQRFNILEEKILFNQFSNNNNHANDNSDSLSSFVTEKTNNHLDSSSSSSSSSSQESKTSSFRASDSLPKPSLLKTSSEDSSTESPLSLNTQYDSYHIAKAPFLAKFQSNSYHNSTRADSGKKFAQRFMKLIKQKQNLTMFSKTMRVNGTYLDYLHQHHQHDKQQNDNNNHSNPSTTPMTIIDRNVVDRDPILDNSSARTGSVQQFQKDEGQKPTTTNIHNRNIDTINNPEVAGSDGNLQYQQQSKPEIDYDKCRQLMLLFNLKFTGSQEEMPEFCIRLSMQLDQVLQQISSQVDQQKEVKNSDENVAGNGRQSQVEKRDRNEEIVTNNSLHPQHSGMNFEQFQNNFKRQPVVDNNNNNNNNNNNHQFANNNNLNKTPEVPTSQPNQPGNGLPAVSSSTQTNPPNQPTAGSVTPPQKQYDESLESLTTDQKNSKIDHLEAQLQYFSTKMIKIVEEMWRSSLSSEKYLKETLSIANETKLIMRSEIGKLQHSLKPVDQLPNVIDEIREPLINRLQELSTTINNSVQVILNTQAQYIDSCRLTREEEFQLHLIEVLEFFVNKSNLGLSALSHNMQIQEQKMNTTVEFLLYRLSGISAQTSDSIRTESARLENIIKEEIRKQIGALQENRGFSLNALNAQHALFEQLSNMSEKSGKQFKTSASGSPFHSPSSTQTGSGNDCFMSKEDFANICLNIDRKPSFPEQQQQQQQQQQTYSASPPTSSLSSSSPSSVSSISGSGNSMSTQTQHVDSQVTSGLSHISHTHQSTEPTTLQHSLPSVGVVSEQPSQMQMQHQQSPGQQPTQQSLQPDSNSMPPGTPPQAQQIHQPSIPQQNPPSSLVDASTQTVPSPSQSSSSSPSSSPTSGSPQLSQSTQQTQQTIQQHSFMPINNQTQPQIGNIEINNGNRR